MPGARDFFGATQTHRDAVATVRVALSVCLVLASLLSLIGRSMPALANNLNGFELGDALIPAAEVFRGGPPKDGIASVDQPRFIAPDEAKLKPEQRVMGVSFAGQVRAYPISILSRHEVVNDRFGSYYVAITYCPLCGSGMVFRAPKPDQPLTFGVSGLLYNSDVLLYDRETESLWSQLLMQAISGPRAGERLKLLTASHTSWQDWLKRFPDTQVLSEDTGFDFDYSRDPYEGYKNTGDVWFPVANQNNAYGNKEWVMGVVIDGLAKAYPFRELELTSGDFIDEINGQSVRILWSKDARSAQIFDARGEEMPAVTAYWFAWFGFYPQTQVYRAVGP